MCGRTKIFLQALSGFLLLAWAAGEAAAQSLTDYTAYPPFTSTAIEPNVLILLDNSGSMNRQAYDTDDQAYNWDFSFDGKVPYYGYFDPEMNYAYSSNQFVENPAGNWDGNFLNWLTMRRIDVAKKVLVGGKAASRSGRGNPHTLVGLNPPRNGACCRSFLKYYEDNVSPYYTPYYNRTTYYVIDNGRIYVYRWSRRWVYEGSFQIRVRVSDEPAGVIQQIGEKVRWGLEIFNLQEGGRVRRRVGFNLNSLIVAIENINPETWTPLAEAFYEGVRYFQQVRPYYNRGDYVTNQTHDPYYYDNYRQHVRCCKSFTLLITDGESTQDLNIPFSLRDHDGDGHDPGTYSSSGSDYLDDVALWAHTEDLRPDLDGIQSLTLYTVFAFGSGSKLLKDAATNGGFTELNGDQRPGPDAREWDADQDDIPDNYFEAQDGYELETSLLTALTDILRRSSSGTSVSVQSTSGEGEGAAYQAFFYPSRLEGPAEVKWMGYLQGLFLDSMGNLREDTNANHRLDLADDQIIRLEFDESSGEIRVERYTDKNGDALQDSKDPQEIIPFDEIRPIWEAGRELAVRSADSRQIYTWMDGNSDGRVGSGEFIEFDAGRSDILRPYLRASGTRESRMIINYIRGENVPGYRNRSLNVDETPRVWKLGDIVSSTPVVVGPPQEQFDLIYKDESYLEFLNRYKNRRNVVYVGANDGMLHAFNAGVYDPDTHAFSPGTGTRLGEELWAYVPYELLPHLKWLTLPEYTHVYYVDLTPKVTDAKIFPEDKDHPGGWGTVLMGGFRMGGGRIDVTDDFGSGRQTRIFRSAYFLMDITNPEAPPTLLWSFTDSDLGFTTSYPALARVQGTSGAESWLGIMGSGPTGYQGDKDIPNLFHTSSTGAYLYALDLMEGTLIRKLATDTSGFMGDPVTLDANLDFTVDTVYVGSSDLRSGTWRGRLYRLVTNQVPEPDRWSLSTVLTADSPILAAPSVSVDSFSNIWVYAGTGRFISPADKSDPSPQFVYGTMDPCWFVEKKGCPHEISIDNLVDASAAMVFQSGTVKGLQGISTFGGLLGTARLGGGWRLRLPERGERLLAKPVILGGVVIFTTFVPDTADVCAFEGKSKLYALYYETGTAYTEDVIGAQEDGALNRDIRLGEGMASRAGLHLGAQEKAKGFVQLGTGEIAQIEAELLFKIKSGTVLWQEK